MNDISDIQVGDRVRIRIYQRDDQGKHHPSITDGEVIKVESYKIEVLPDGAKQIEWFWPMQIIAVLASEVSK